MISVIIPIYNAEKTIAHCIESVLFALDIGDELILINDGSEDETEIICNEYASKTDKIRLFCQGNKGPSAARNVGMEKAVNPYVCFVDSDDEVNSANFCEFLNTVRESKEKVDIWFNDFIMMTPQRQICKESSSIEIAPMPQYGKEKLIAYLSGQGTYANVWRCIFRRAFLEERNLRFADEIRCGEDLLFMTQVIMFGETFAFYHLPYYHYIVERGESLSHNYSLKRVTDFLESFNISYSIAQTGDVGELLKAKLLQELMMIIPQLVEVNREDRDAGYRAFLLCAPCLQQSQAVLHRMMYFAVKCMGVSLVSRCLCLMKQWKRRRNGLSKKWR